MSHLIRWSRPQFIFDELREQLVRKFGYSTTEADEAVALVESTTDTVVPKQFDQPVCRDADDDQFLGTGIAGAADCIITGDKDLLILERYEGIEIITPNGFVDFETRRSLPGP